MLALFRLRYFASIRRINLPDQWNDSRHRP